MTLLGLNQRNLDLNTNVAFPPNVFEVSWMSGLHIKLVEKPAGVCQGSRVTSEADLRCENYFLPHSLRSLMLLRRTIGYTQKCWWDQCDPNGTALRLEGQILGPCDPTRTAILIAVKTERRMQTACGRFHPSGRIC